ncbi:MAG: ABC transporter ATP-binding protein/permease [Ruminococcus sp.]|nr:ABC transporter ATP-binding protein/permease [Ruminococcus sp.]
MIRTLKYLTKKEWGLVFLALVFIVVQVWLEMTMPGYMSDITLLIETEGSEMSDILSAGSKMLACALGSLVSSIIVAAVSARIASNYSAVLRGKLFHKVQSFSMEEIGHFSTASLITRSTNDVTQVQMLIVMGLQMLIKAPITAVWGICKIVGKAWEWTLIIVIAVVVLLLVVGICIALAFPKFRKMQLLTDDINRVTRENLTGLQVVRAYNAEKYQEDKFDRANNNLNRTQLFTYRVMAFLMPTIQMIMSGISLAVYWVGAVLINDSAMDEKMTLFSDMVVFSQYAVYVIMSFMMLVMIFMMLPRASVAGKRIMEVMDTKCRIIDGTRKNGESGQSGEIEFRDVSFRYLDSEGAEGNVLEHISFTAHRGETIAFIGSTGCGKSTLINLVPRFYDVTEGQVLVDGVNVKEYAQKELRNKIGYVSQKATLFGGTIRSNVSYGDNGKQSADTEQVAEAIEIAQASEFVEKLADKYDNFVAQGGSNFSGGQKQRLSISRAIARDPEILIFDDSFSALDYKTDRILRNALQKHCKNTTKMIVAQRIGTIRDVDKIVVLDDGKVAGIGTHKELMQNCETYQQIALSQLSKEELA